MPVVAIPAAVVAIGFAASAVSTAVAVGVVTLSTVLAVTAAVGATLAAVGSVTGSKELQIAGTVLGVVGGVGSLAAGSGLFGNIGATELFSIGGAASEVGSFGAAGVGELGLANAGEGVTSLATPPPAGDLSSGIRIEGVVSGHQAETLGVPSGIGDAPRTGLSDTLGYAPNEIGSVKPPDALPDPTPAVQTPTPAPADAAAGTVIDPQTPSTGVVAPQAPTQAPVAAPSTPAAPGLVGPDGLFPGSMKAAESAVAAYGAIKGVDPITGAVAGGGIFSDILGMLGKPGMNTLTAGVLQAGGAFISGAMKTDYAGMLTPAQINALNAQAEANIAAANLQKRQIEMMNQPMPGVTNSGVTVTPPRPGNGLINQARATPPGNGLINQPAVTGQPAMPVTGTPA